jgi:environmental stress-induced protein Ves
MIIHLRDCPPQPWKNGLGQTREMAVQPVSDSSHDLLWRVSIAEVTCAAPFSAFPGIDRTIVLLDGAGFTMTLDGGQTHALTTRFVPFAFPGEAAVEVQLAGGPTRDFNLMVRRTQARGEVQVWREAATHALDPAIVLIYCARGGIDTTDGTLHAGDAWRPVGTQAGAVTVRADTVALVARVVRHAS